MGARASRRRHEGRRIRKIRRQWGCTLTALNRASDVMPALAGAMMEFGAAVARVQSKMGMLVEVWDTPSGSIATAQRPDGTILVGIDPGVGHPSHSGVEAVRSPSVAAQQVDDAAARMGLRLTPWQHDLAVAALAGTPIDPLVGGKGAGRTTVQRVLAEVRGPEAGKPIVDEIHRMPLG